MDVTEFLWTGDFYTPGSGASQTWTVPDGVRYAWVAVWGGGTNEALGFVDDPNRAIYARIDGLTPGDAVYVNCGGSNRYYNRYFDSGGAYPAGPVTAAGWNGGGSRTITSTGSLRSIATGGGATDIRLGSNDPGDRVLVAGGYGGAGAGTGYAVRVEPGVLVPNVTDLPRAVRTAAEFPLPTLSTFSASVAGGTYEGGTDATGYAPSLGSPTMYGVPGGGGAGGGASGNILQLADAPGLAYQTGRAGGFYADPATKDELPPGVDSIGEHPGISSFATFVGGAARIWWDPSPHGWAIDETRF